MNNLCGFVNIIKPTGMTSSDVVIKIKKILKMKRVGHLGTLDPAASGVLPVAVGKATKFFDYFLSKEKKYTALVEFGVETDTLDSFGNITKIDCDVDIEEQQIKNILKYFIGEIEQIPPKYSAIKIDGKKACDLARENINFEIKPRKITIFDVKLLKKCDKNKYIFNVHCSAGTYIRTLFADIANKLGTVATTPVIIRTKSGAFENKNAITLEEFAETQRVVSLEEIFEDLPKVELVDSVAKRVLNGVKIKAEDICVSNLKGDFLITQKGEIVGLFCVNDGKVQPKVFLYENN